MNCTEKRKILNQIKTFAKKLRLIIGQSLDKKSLSQIKAAHENDLVKTKELINNLTVEILIDQLKLPEQYERELSTLKQTGLVEELSPGQWGIRDAEGYQYPIPTYQEIEKRLRERYKSIKQEIRQGYNRLLLVPFALPIEKLFSILKQVIQKNDQIFDSCGRPINSKILSIDIEREHLMRQEQMRYFSFDLENDEHDEDQELLPPLYYSYLKSELLTWAKPDHFPGLDLTNGWNILLLPEPKQMTAYQHLVTSVAPEKIQDFFKLINRNNDTHQPILLEDWLTLIIIELYNNHRLMGWNNAKDFTRDDPALVSKKIAFIANNFTANQLSFHYKIFIYPKERNAILSFGLDRFDDQKLDNYFTYTTVRI